eukprot:31379-Pelagococcus_subviridis.AAC.15
MRHRHLTSSTSASSPSGPALPDGCFFTSFKIFPAASARARNPAAYFRNTRENTPCNASSGFPRVKFEHRLNTFLMLMNTCPADARTSPAAAPPNDTDLDALLLRRALPPRLLRDELVDELQQLALLELDVRSHVVLEARAYDAAEARLGDRRGGGVHRQRSTAALFGDFLRLATGLVLGADLPGARAVLAVVRVVVVVVMNALVAGVTTVVGAAAASASAAVLPDAEVLVEVPLELDRSMQRLQQRRHLRRAGVVVQQQREIRPRELTQRHAQELRDFPSLRKHPPHLLLLFQVALDPRVASLRGLELRVVVAVRPVERRRVVEHLFVRDVAYELLSDVRLQRVDDEARVREARRRARVALDHRGLPRRVEVFDDVRSQRAADVGVFLLQRRDFRDVVVSLEVRRELVDRLEEVRAVAVLAAHRHLFELFERADEHAEASKRGDRSREVPLRVVELFDVLARLLDHDLALRRFRLDLRDPRVELRDRALRVLEVRLRARAAGALRPHRAQDLVVYPPHAQPQFRDERVHSAEVRLVGEQAVDEVDGVEVGGGEDVPRRARGALGGRGRLGRGVHIRHPPAVLSANEFRGCDFRAIAIVK